MSRTFEYRASALLVQFHVGLPAANRRTSLRKRYLGRPSAPRSQPTAPCPVAGPLERSFIRDGCRALDLLLAAMMTSMVVGGVEGGEARVAHVIPRVALVIFGVAAFHRVEVLDEVLPGGLH
jgi:hypothetical protein